MKKLQGAGFVLAGMLAGLLLSSPVASAAGAWMQAERSAQTVYIDGAEAELEAYLIDGANYVKLRDIAEKTDAFNVYWDGAVRIETGAAYTGEGPGSSAPGAPDTFPTKTAWANYTDTSALYEGGLNKDLMWQSAVRHLPLYKFDTRAELEQFKEDFEGVLAMNAACGEVPSFSDATAGYDDAFFSEHTLLLAYVSAGSGSYRFGVYGISLSDSSFCMYVEQTNDPEVGTADMSGWYVMAELTDEALQGCTNFDAQLGRPF